MYRGFNLPIVMKEDHNDYTEWIRTGKNMFNEYSLTARPHIREFAIQENNLDGTAIQESWFPNIDADVFLSYSHDDLDQAYALAGYLYKHFKLKTFIDSAIWGYCDTLLREIDNDHCIIKGSALYSYWERNRSTAHVHMMLSTALTMMMDKTECVFFLNTPNSIQPFQQGSKTSSPWLYAENVATQTLRCNPPERYMRIEESFLGSDGSRQDLEKAFNVEYLIDISHLDDLTSTIMEKWVGLRNRPSHKLDILYELITPRKKKYI